MPGAFCGMRGCEIKALQWKDGDFVAGVLDIRHSKTPAGWRAPTLNSVCKESLAALRAKAIVADHARPERYLFPATVKSKLDPSQHAKGWRSAWRSMRRKAATNDEGEVIYPNLLTVRFSRPTAHSDHGHGRGRLTGSNHHGPSWTHLA